ncbi:AraC family transcriptional regulator [Prescottella defluvii]|nr:AraC family transcriptional regulator [Prescottella defluvii]
MRAVRVRISVLNEYVELAQSLGLDPHPVMREAGIDPATFATPDAWIAARAVNDLLQHTAGATSCEDFGVRMAAGRRISNLGPVGMVAREEPDVRSALEIVLRYMRLYNEAIRTRLVEMNGLATLHVEPAQGLQLGRQSIELAVASIARILGSLLPGDWRPLSTCFAHDAPADLDVYHRVLGPHVAFGRDFNGLALYSSDLDAVNPLSDPLLRPYARQYLDLLTPPEDTSTVGRVRDIIEALLPGGNCSATRIARSLGMDRRTLHRHLAQSEETYTSVVDAVRADLAVRYIARDGRTLTDIAGELGFSDLSAFSRWFRRRFGQSPTAWAASERELGSL